MARIIIADDDEIVATIVSDALFAAGHAVGWVQDGASALEVVRRRAPALLILDCNMPGKSGIMVLRELRQSPHLYALPVLMLTARGSGSDEEIARYEGANDYLTKPFDPIELVDRVGDLVAGRRRFA